MQATSILLLFFAAYVGLTLLLTIGLAAFVMWDKLQGDGEIAPGPPLIPTVPTPALTPHAFQPVQPMRASASAGYLDDEFGGGAVGVAGRVDCAALKTRRPGLGRWAAGSDL